MKQPIPVFEGDIVDNKLKLSDRERKAMSLWCNTFLDGTHLDVTIRKHKEKRTNDQNRYYFGVVIPILADFFGHDSAEAMHEDLKLKFNPVDSKLDKSKKIGGSTTKMSTVDFYSAENSYIERIVRWASIEYSIYIPPPVKSEPE